MYTLLRFLIIVFHKLKNFGNYGNNQRFAKRSLINADAKAVSRQMMQSRMHKLALEEAFTPHLKSMLAAKLDEMDKKTYELKLRPVKESEYTRK